MAWDDNSREDDYFRGYDVGFDSGRESGLEELYSFKGQVRALLISLRAGDEDLDSLANKLEVLTNGR